MFTNTITYAYKDVPISIFISLLIIIVFLLYITTIIKTIPCDKDLTSVFISNFVHVDYIHVLSNLFAVYALSRVERDIGFSAFGNLIIFLLVFNTIGEIILHKLIPREFSCSIGFSGVLFGVLTYELVHNNDIDIFMLMSIAVTVITPSLTNSNVSFSGHLIGAIGGIVAGIIANKV